MRIKRLLALPAAAALVSAATIPLASAAQAAPPEPGPRPAVGSQAGHGAEYIPSKLEQRANQLRQEAIKRRLAGDPTAQGDVIPVGTAPKGGPAGAANANAADGPSSKTQYVNYARTGTGKIFVIIAEYGTAVDPRYGTYEDGSGPIAGYANPGPQHNQIAEPDRSVDNTTIYQPDYTPAGYEHLYFGKTEGTSQIPSVAHFYKRQSSGRFTFQGEVSDWVKVQYNGASYGSDYCGSIVCHNVWNLVIEAANNWAADQAAAGKTPAQIKAALAKYDVEDRYDHDSDGNFKEPDGYLDHFQILHAGEDEAAGGGKNPASGDYGENAIWSHKWYVNDNNIGVTGPPTNMLGGTQVGSTGIWIGDYTIQPENAGVGVIAHETAHDYGLPDEYDTSGAGESSAAFWTLMSSGSYMSKGGVDLGSRAGVFTAWDKLQLGWLDYEVREPGDAAGEVQLGPSESANTAGPQALIQKLPQKTVTFHYPKPFSGQREWWSGSGDNLNNWMTHGLNLTNYSGTVATAKVNYDIEEGFDYLYTEISTDGGATFQKVTASVDGVAQPSGLSGSTDGAWAQYSLDLSPYSGKKIQLRLRYQTDGGVAPQGFFLDNLAVRSGGTTLFGDAAETGDNGWALNGFKRTTSTETKLFDNYYVAESRSYQSFDDTLATGPYNFGFPARPNYVEHFRYQQGLLISYWDLSVPNNEVGVHPGSGQILPIDARPGVLLRPDGTPWRTRVQVYDATFSLRASPKMTLHQNGQPSYIPSQPAVPTFDDSLSYWNADKPDSSVIVPHTGTQITVQAQDSPSLGAMKLWVQPPPS